MNHILYKKVIFILHKQLTAFLLTITFFISVFALSGCQSPQTITTINGFYFDTIVSITLYETDAEKAAQLEQSCKQLMQDYEMLFSRTIPGSDIWNINHSNGSSVKVSKETICLLEKAIYYAELSEGLVDPTIGSLSQLWNFGSDADTQIPAPEEITQALSHVDYRTILIKDNTVTLSDSKAVIDLGFIAKGYIADRLKDYLLSQGIQHGIINLGGNILTIGTKPDHSPYQIGIQKPFANTKTALMTLPVSDSSLVSSGNYERYFMENDTLYHHILSTKDGYPVTSDLSQVTIINQSSADGDALSTLCFILGYEKGAALIASLPDTEAVFVRTDGTVHKTFDTP